MGLFQGVFDDSSICISLKGISWRPPGLRSWIPRYMDNSLIQFFTSTT